MANVINDHSPFNSPELLMLVTAARYRRGLTLIEVVLVMGLILLITALAVPNFLREFQREQLPGSASQMRSLLTLTRANAAFDGRRYRIRCPEESEQDALGGNRQPIIERENDPVREPDIFYPVNAAWAIGKTLLGDVWCVEVRLGRPTVDTLRERRSAIEDAIERSREEFAPERPPLYIEPDASSDWATFVLVEGPRELSVEDAEEYPRLEVILEGATGLTWVQRPLYDEELDLFEEKNWPVVLRQDLLNSKMLTEDDVLELREVWVK